jgi:large subunit ribosomal protein L25
MERKELNVELRTRTGKGISRQLRRCGLIPGIVYGKGMEAVPVAVNAREMAEAISGEGGHNNLITLKGGATLDGNVVIMAEVDRDPLKGRLRHVDLHKISLTDRIKVEVPINIVGTALGVKNGGLLDFAMHSVEIECLPTEIPEHIDVDVTNVGINQAIHVGELKLPAGVKVLEDAKASVVSVLGKAKEEAAPGETA